MPDATTAIVAVVDDDPRILESLEELLESAGHVVRLYASARELLEVGGISDIDCLISDIEMPGMDGVALRRLVRNQRPDLPVILITGDPDLTARRHGVECPGRLLFGKPFNAGDLLAAVGAEICASRRSG